MIKQMFDKTAPQNVHGWERAASLAGGLVMIGKGLRRGGLIGTAELAMGGMALARGISGRCEAKRMLAEMESKPALPSQRSEEQTYELQSQMRISYAVFCLKKNKTCRGK